MSAHHSSCPTSATLIGQIFGSLYVNYWRILFQHPKSHSRVARLVVVRLKVRLGDFEFVCRHIRGRIARATTMTAVRWQRGERAGIIRSHRAAIRLGRIRPQI